MGGSGWFFLPCSMRFYVRDRDVPSALGALHTEAVAPEVTVTRRHAPPVPAAVPRGSTEFLKPCSFGEAGSHAADGVPRYPAEAAPRVVLPATGPGGDRGPSSTLLTRCSGGTLASPPLLFPQRGGGGGAARGDPDGRLRRTLHRAAACPFPPPKPGI